MLFYTQTNSGGSLEFFSFDEDDESLIQQYLKPGWTRISNLPTENNKPAYDPLTQTLARDGIEKVGDVWQYKWRIDALSAEKIAAFQGAAATALQKAVVDATQARLDAFAQLRSYDSILSACTYANSTVAKFQAEGQYCVNARDATWAKLYAILADVQAGARTMPRSYADIEPELPALVWPA